MFLLASVRRRRLLDGETELSFNQNSFYVTKTLYDSPTAVAAAASLEHLTASNTITGNPIYSFMFSIVSITGLQYSCSGIIHIPINIHPP